MRAAGCADRRTLRCGAPQSPGEVTGAGPKCRDADLSNCGGSAPHAGGKQEPRRHSMNAVVMRLCAAVVLALAPLASSAQAVEVEGVKLDPAAQVGGANLVLNGAGVRTRAIFKVYVAGLYVPQKSNNAA